MIPGARSAQRAPIFHAQAVFRLGLVARTSTANKIRSREMRGDQRLPRGRKLLRRTMALRTGDIYRLLWDGSDQLRGGMDGAPDQDASSRSCSCTTSLTLPAGRTRCARCGTDVAPTTSGNSAAPRISATGSTRSLPRPAPGSPHGRRTATGSGPFIAGQPGARGMCRESRTGNESRMRPTNPGRILATRGGQLGLRSPLPALPAGPAPPWSAGRVALVAADVPTRVNSGRSFRALGRCGASCSRPIRRAP